MAKLVISRDQWSGTKEQLEANVAYFRQQIEAHKLTVGVPAPFIQDEIIEHLVKNPDVEFELEPEPEPIDPPPPNPLTAKALLARIEMLEESFSELRDALGR